MGRGDVSLTFDANTAKIVQAILALHNQMLATADPARKMGEGINRVGIEIETLAEISEKAAHDVAADNAAMAESTEKYGAAAVAAALKVIETNKQLGISYEETTAEQIRLLSSGAAANEEASEASIKAMLARSEREQELARIASATNQRAADDIAFQQFLKQEAFEKSAAVAQVSADATVAAMDREAFAVKLAADELEAFKIRMAEVAAASEGGFLGVGEAAETMAGKIGAAMTSVQGMFGTVTIALVAIGSAISTVNSELTQTEKRAKLLTDSNRSISEAVNDAGLAPAQPGGEATIDYLKGSFNQGAQNTYPGNIQISESERGTLFAGIEGQLGGRATAGQYSDLVEKAAQEVAAGASDQNAINTVSDAFLLNSLGGGQGSPDADRNAAKTIESLGGSISDAGAFLARLTAGNKPSSVRLFEASLASETGSRALRTVTSALTEDYAEKSASLTKKQGDPRTPLTAEESQDLAAYRAISGMSQDQILNYWIANPGNAPVNIRNQLQTLAGAQVKQAPTLAASQAAMASSPAEQQVIREKAINAAIDATARKQAEEASETQALRDLRDQINDRWHNLAYHSPAGYLAKYGQTDAESAAQLRQNAIDPSHVYPLTTRQRIEADLGALRTNNIGGAPAGTQPHASAAETNGLLREMIGHLQSMPGRLGDRLSSYNPALNSNNVGQA